MNQTKQAVYLPILQLHPFEGHPFKVQDNEEMDALVESIQGGGILTPLIVRPMDGKENEYEVISGHRWLHAAIKAGMETVPAIVAPMSRDAAAIALVDSNLHREHIQPSEKAFAYKLKRDALTHQGKTSHQVGEKLLTAEKIGRDGGDSMNQVLRYIRLTNLIPGILEKVDEGRIALTPAVELSYLTETEQAGLLETMESEDCTPSLSQAQHMRQMSSAGKLSIDVIFYIMTQPKPNQQEKISFKVDEIRRYFPKDYTAAQMTRDILKGLELLQRQRNRDRGER